MKMVPLGGKTSSGLMAMVDEGDFELVINWCTWRVSRDGYAVGHTRGDLNSYCAMHRVVMGLGKGDPPIDHINGDRLDNRKSNLRLTDPQSNSLNQAIETGVGTSVYRGVVWNKASHKWQASQRYQGHLYYLGLFGTEDDAAAAIARFRIERGFTIGYAKRRGGG